MRPIALRVSDLVEFLEDQIPLIKLNAAASVPYLNAKPIGSTPAADQHAPLACITYGVGEKIAEDAFQQDRISLDYQAAWKQTQLEALALHLWSLFAANPVEQRLNCKRPRFAFDYASVKA